MHIPLLPICKGGRAEVEKNEKKHMGPHMHNALGCSQVDEGLPEVSSAK